MVALTDVDHRYLADIANYWRPGSGTYVEVASTDHGMNLVGSRDAIRQRNREGGEPLTGEFNPRVVDALAEWIKASLAKPPLGGLGRRGAFADQEVLDIGERSIGHFLVEGQTTRRSTSL